MNIRLEKICNLSMLKEQIQKEINQAIKEGDDLTCNALRMLSASIVLKEKEKRYKISKKEQNLSEKELNEKSQLTDEEVIEVIVSEIKKRKDAIALYEQGKRPELAEKERKEIEVLKKYLPEQLSEEELKKLVQESIEKVRGPKEFLEIKDMGKVMADLMPKIKGRADSGLVSKMVKELLSPKVE